MEKGNNKINSKLRFFARRCRREVYSAPRLLLLKIIQDKSRRKIINNIYDSLGGVGQVKFHDYFISIFRDFPHYKIEDSVWHYTFNNKVVYFPIEKINARRDWELAVSVGYEKDILETYIYLINHSKPQLYLDIGGNHGLHSIMFLTQGIRAITFEPNPTCHEYFKKICLLNKVSFELVKKAVSDQNGSCQLEFPENETWLGSIVPAVQQMTKETGSDIRSVTVDQITLDEYMADKMLPASLIKIDTEGKKSRFYKAR